MSEPLENLYFNWLYAQVASLRNKNPRRNYTFLLRQLHQKEFVDIIPNDDNRREDGRDLRLEFFEEVGAEPDDEWLHLGCSFLEMLIGLARRASFAASEGDTLVWFWTMLTNLGVRDFNDDLYEKDNPEEEINLMLDEIIWRTYNYDGSGGLFPLREPVGDQRDVELWYQLCAYLIENE